MKLWVVYESIPYEFDRGHKYFLDNDKAFEYFEEQYKMNTYYEIIEAETEEE